MSRVGKRPVVIPAGVDVKVEDNVITVTGPKGTLTETINKDITIEIANGEITFSRPSDVKEHRSLHGLSRALVANMVTGVTEGFKKTLKVNGVGYRVQKQGSDLTMNLGYSHPVIVSEIPGITIEAPDANTIVISGPDKQKVGQFAADIRSKRPPEPYKGKGVKYEDEVIRRKEGKAGKK